MSFSFSPNASRLIVPATTEFVVAAHDLPLGVEADGLLGLDFFRGFVLTLDFVRGRITLAPKHWWQFWR